ncbi:MAG TPA: tRNA (adenosine(37)-N6)-threonylcarbamoyltransferase complex dimerization subunit type 1 TsaB [Gammaproteobacteria bacterium]|nr:tRNA (adenosine(37)-N6)-threonylcarbamoyltransferase complex dimerization subunit type 1 TsaB [Gammaproteobacteria bacterium]
MKLLAIDTATDACSAALLIDRDLRERSVLAPREHARLILPMIESLLDEAGMALVALDALAFGRGPGSFTGLRIAAGIVQGLALGADLPVVAVSDLAALAQGAMRRHGWPAVLAALDARMGEVYWGGYVHDEAGWAVPATAEAVSPPQAVRAGRGPDWHGAGPGWAVHGPALAAALGREVPHDAGCLPQASDVARLAVRDFARGAAVAADEALPVYLRDRVAWSR